MAPKYTDKLAGQRVLVIGGTSGIGYGVAQALVDHGSTVIISSSNPDKIKRTIAQLEADYPAAAGKGQITGQACNIGGADAEAQIAALFQFAAPTPQSLDHVVYTAADSLPIRNLQDWTLDLMKQAGQLRFFGPLMVSQHLTRALKPGNNSSFTITSGGVADKPTPDWTVINSYAAGLQGMARGLALDLAPLRVNCVCPGPVDTELWDGLRDSGNFDEVMKAVVSKTLTGAIGQVSDVAEAYLWVLKDRNVTGTIVNSNAGSLLK